MLREILKSMPGVRRIVAVIRELRDWLARIEQAVREQADRQARSEHSLRELSNWQTQFETKLAVHLDRQRIADPVGTRIRAIETEVQLAALRDRIEELSKEFLSFTCSELPQVIDHRVDALTQFVRSNREEVEIALLRMGTELESVAMRLVASREEKVEESNSRDDNSTASSEACPTAAQGSTKIFATPTEDQKSIELQHSRLAAEWVSEEWRYLCPMIANDAEFIRIGREGDGGYVMVDDFIGVGHGVSIGIGTELSWDLSMADRGIKMLLVDHTIPELAATHPNFKFERVGLGTLDSDAPDLAPLSKIIELAGLDTSEKAILKIDVEGHEWEALIETDSAEFKKFSQIVIELHGLADYSDHDAHLRRLYVLRNLAATHQVVHLHANNWGGYKIVGGKPVPDVVECTWVRRDLFTFSEFDRNSLQVHKDVPNNADKADIEIPFEILCQGASASIARP
jgi:hypothetical protein